MSESAFCLRRIAYFTHDQICNPNHNYDLKYWQVYQFVFKVNQIITPASQHHNGGGIGHSVTLIIKSVFCTVWQVDNSFLKFRAFSDCSSTKKCSSKEICAAVLLSKMFSLEMDNISLRKQCKFFTFKINIPANWNVLYNKQITNQFGVFWCHLFWPWQAGPPCSYASCSYC